MSGFLDKLKASIQGPEPVDPSRFGEPLALSISWEPLERGGASFQTHVLKQAHSDLIYFGPSTGMKLFAGGFMAMGGVVAVVFPIASGVVGVGSEPALGTMGGIMGLVVGSVFAIVGYKMGRSYSKPRIFDRRRRLYIIGKESDDGTRHSLEDLKALQLLHERIRGNDSSYSSYELNLIFGDGKRLNVVDHGNLAQMRRDAQLLGEFLSVPVWDGVG